MPGMGELIIILLIVLVVFGANKLPGIGDALGRSIKNFKRASKTGDDDDDKDDKDEKATSEEPKQIVSKPAPKQLDKGDADDDEWEEVVVRRRKKSASE